MTMLLSKGSEHATYVSGTARLDMIHDTSGEW